MDDATCKVCHHPYKGVTFEKFSWWLPEIDYWSIHEVFDWLKAQAIYADRSRSFSFA
jgi:hypothetical protein